DHFVVGGSPKKLCVSPPSNFVLHPQRRASDKSHVPQTTYFCQVPCPPNDVLQTSPMSPQRRIFAKCHVLPTTYFCQVSCPPPHSMLPYHSKFHIWTQTLGSKTVAKTKLNESYHCLI